jgi:hypothetical protein
MILAKRSVLFLCYVILDSSVLFYSHCFIPLYSALKIQVVRSHVMILHFVDIAFVFCNVIPA